MNGYAAAVRQFYDIYRPIARKYGLRMSSHTSISVSYTHLTLPTIYSV